MRKILAHNFCFVINKQLGNPPLQFELLISSWEWGKSYNFIGHLAVAVIGIRDGKQISYEDFSFLKLPYPTIKEQKKIAQVLTLADREIDLYKEQLDKLKLEKKSLMQQLLTGQKRVKLDT